MKRREAVLGLFAAAFVVLALLTVFAIELSNTQAKSKRDVESRVHERAILAAALIDSLFQTTTSGLPQDTKTYGAAQVSSKLMNAKQGHNLYLALLDSNYHVIAQSTGFTAQAQGNFAHSTALALIRSGRPYGLGNVLPYGKTGVINFAVKFPTPSGERILMTGLAPSALGIFVVGELHKIPGVKGSYNYLLDGNDTVIASTNPGRPTGYRFTQPPEIKALSHSSGDRDGHYYDQVTLTDSTERILLAAPNGPLFASVSGLRKWVPWGIFVAFALFALLALLLGRRALRQSDRVREANERLEHVNDELASTNAQLERRAQELARSNAELEQFASIASHDLQEPLRKIRTFTQQLEVGERDTISDKGADYLRRANAAAARMQNLIEDLLRFSRVATHGRPFAPVDLAQVASEVLEDLEAQVERSGAVIKVGALPTINADALQMRQLLQNLISNAIKFRRDGVTPELSIDARLLGGTVQLVVKDNGIGFEQQYSHRIFRVFERLHGRSEYPGTGIGLALCRKIAERHGGNVIAEGEPGAGSTFTVTLPLHRQTEDAFKPFGADRAPAADPEESHALA
jgi:signal transduction histidine kinase